VALPFCAMRPEDVEADLRRVLRRTTSGWR
jgi:hypothetical protein